MCPTLLWKLKTNTDQMDTLLVAAGVLQNTCCTLTSMFPAEERGGRGDVAIPIHFLHLWTGTQI